MKIDVIIPTFNRKNLLERSIESVLAQTHKSFLLHIVDDGSTDGTETFLKKYSTHPQIALYRKINQGVSCARNFAAMKSKTPWISFLDSDDEWMPEKLAVQVDFLSANPWCSFLHSDEQWIRNDVRVNPKKKHSKNCGSEDLFLRSLDFCVISPSTVIMKRELFNRYDGFNESFLVCEDYDLWLKILSHHGDEVGYINLHLIKKYGGHRDQLSSKFVAMDYWRIKSLVDLLIKGNLSEDKNEQIKTVIRKKSDILLRNYLKHQNQKAHDEIRDLLILEKII